jgi:hypothetical protein
MLIYFILTEIVMKSIRLVALTLVTLMLFSVLGSFSSIVVEPNDQPIILEDEEVVFSANSQGHPVFSQYITSDNCGFCYQYGSPAHHSLKTQFPDEFVYISYQSVSYGDTDTARAGNTNGYNWPWTASGAPDSYWGDRLDKRANGCGSNTCYDSMYNTGGGMSAGVTSQYSLSAAVSENGNQLDVSITADYVGSGTPASNIYLYAAMTEETCNSYVYSDGSKGHNCWKGWLMSGSTYKTSSGGTGSSFESVSLSSGSVSFSWSVPKNMVSGGGSNALVVAALMSGAPSSGANSEHVLTATDSGMVPLIDIGVEALNLDNPGVASGYINGDIIDLQAVVKNYGVEEYTDGGDVRFYYKNGNTKNYVGSTQSLSNFASQGTIQTFNGQIDTSALPESNYQTTFGVELSNLVSDAVGADNDATEIVPHDLVPVARKAEVIGSNNIERGSSFLVEAKAGINDGVDINLATMTFEIEVSPTGANQWNGDIVSGGDEIFNEGTSNEHRQYLVQPTMNMGAGDYDLRSRAIDSRGQMSSWEITEDSFALLNALPIITAEPVPTVKVETTTRVSIIANVADAETDLSDLVITSSSPNFIAWHASSEEVEVYFENIRYVGGEPVASGIEVSVDDGTDVAHGTLLFNVIENGQPRWAGVEKQYVDEASSDILDLIQYLSDTDSNGNVVTSQDLVLAIVDNTNPEIINVELSGSYLEYETTDDDVNGMTTVTVRASDGIQFSDQQIAIQISPINDAPRLDLSEFEGLRLKAGTQQVIFVDGLLTDVDSDVNEAFVTVTNAVPGAARYNIMDNTITLQWDQPGMQTVTIQSADRYDSNIYTLVVDVYDSAPLLVGEGPDADVRVSVIDLYIEETPAATLFLNKDDVTITSLTSTWQLCNELTGVCTLQVVHEHDITAKSLGWTFDPFLGQVADGMRMKDQVKLTKIVALDNEGNKYEFKDAKYWTITEEAPGPETMDDETLAEYIVELEDAIDSKEDYLATLTEGTTEHTEAKEDLVELRTDLDEACEFGECTSDAPASNTVGPSSSIDLNLTVILIVVSVVVLAALAALLFMRGGRKTEANDFMVDWANQLPSNDAVANSMYGGAGEIFQQPVATPPAPAPAPVAPQVPAGALPLPEGGLPVGWTMEQWVHYGHQYQQ